MWFEHFHDPRVRARTPSVRDRVLVASEDPRFWIALRQEAQELEGTMVLAGSARECLSAVEDPRVKVVILDGALNTKPANQLLNLIKKIRPDLMIVFAYQSPHDEWEREARQAGVLYYGDRARPADMVRVVRQSLPRGVRPRPRSTGAPSDGKAGWS